MWHSSSTTPNQWLINPAELQMLQNSNVDWAALAQKWVEMKQVNSPELSNSAAVPNDDKITTEQVPVDKITDDLIEGGEAPMDMETKDDEGTESLNETNWNNYHSTWSSQWNWNMPGVASTAPLQHLNQGAGTLISGNIIDPLSIHASNVSATVPVITTPTESVITNSSVQVPGSFNYNSLSGGIPPLLPTKPDHWHSNANHKTNRVPVNQKEVPEQYPIMDSSKMKRLPAWIREGLSKMEQEKQKKMQKEKQKTENISSEPSHQNDNNFIKNQISMYDNQLSENEDEQQVDEEKISSHQSGILSSHSSRTPSPLLERNANFTDFHRNPSPESEMPTKAIRKTKDEIMEESMLQVRRVLTSLLLEITEKIVVSIAKEELEKWKSAPIRRIQKSKVLTVSKNANLGLAAYGSDSSESESEDEKSEGDENDSDADLRALIDKKQRDFLLIAEIIDKEIENQEVRERQVMEDEENEEEEINEVKTRSTNSVEKDYTEFVTKNKENGRSVDGNKGLVDEKMYINNEDFKQEKLLNEKLASKTNSKISSSTTSSKSTSSSSSKTSSRDSSPDRKNSRSNQRVYSKTHRHNSSRSPSKSRRADKKKESSRRSRSRSRSKLRSRSRKRSESRSRRDKRSENKSHSDHRSRGDYKDRDRDDRRRHRRSNSRRHDSASSRRDSKRFENSSSSNRYESRRKRSSSRDSKYSNRKRR